jgi:hypothetical protein
MHGILIGKEFKSNNRAWHNFVVIRNKSRRMARKSRDEVKTSNPCRIPAFVLALHKEILDDDKSDPRMYLKRRSKTYGFFIRKRNR